MLLRIPKRPPGSRRQRELKRTEGDKLQAGQGRAAQSTEPQLRPRSTEEPWPPQPACVEGRGTTLPGAAGPSRHRRPPFRKHRGAARTSAARRRNAGDRGGGNCPSGRGGPGPDPLLSYPLAPPAGAPGHVGKGASAPGGVLPSWGQQADLRGPGNRGRPGGTGEAGQPPVTPFALLL